MQEGMTLFDRRNSAKRVIAGMVFVLLPAERLRVIQAELVFLTKPRGSRQPHFEALSEGLRLFGYTARKPRS